MRLEACLQFIPADDVSPVQPGSSKMRVISAPRFRLHTSQSGTALTELALVTPLLLILLMGMIDTGRLFYAWIEVTNAASAGAEYGGSSSSNSLDLTGMQTTAVNDANDVKTITAKAHRRVCTDTNGNPTLNGNPCNSTSTVCDTTNNYQGTGLQSCNVTTPNSVFVDVTTTATVRPLIKWPGLSSATVSLYAKATMRAQ